MPSPGFGGTPGAGSRVPQLTPPAYAFLNLTELDVVERLPSTAPDSRIRYDESPLTYGDLRLPAGGGSGPYPLVVLLHGGGWESSFAADYFGQLAEALTNAGVATWNLEFRRLNNPGAAYPGMFLDVARGVDYVRQLAERYPVDPDRVVLMGHSSGGQLGAWAAARHNLPRTSELYTDNPLVPRGFIDLAGVLDLEYAYAAGRDDVLQVVGATDAVDLASKAQTTSPIRLMPTGVPQTLIIGSRDNAWRIESHHRYVAAAAEAGDTVELVELEGANHFDVVDVGSAAWLPIITAVFKHVDLPLGEIHPAATPSVRGS